MSFDDFFPNKENKPTLRPQPQPKFILDYNNDFVEDSKLCLIIMDYRESKIIPELISILEQEFHRVNISLENLEVGDFKIISPDGKIEYIIERKSISDLVSSLKDGRLDNQIPELLDQENSFFTIIGDPYELKHWANMNTKGQDTVTRFLTGISLKQNLDGNKLPQFILPNIRQLAVQIDYIAKSIESGNLTRVKDGTVRKFKSIKKADKEDINLIRLNQLAILPRMGINKARNVFEYFNWDYIKIQRAGVSELMKIDKIGKVLAKLIYDVYNNEVKK